MIQYALQDIDGDELILNDASIEQPVRGSLSYNEDAFSFENKIIENSALSGAIKLGETRLKSRQINLVYSRAYPSDSDFRNKENEFIQWLDKSVYLIDKTNNLRTKIAPGGININYDSGGHKLSSDNKMSLKLLTPYFEDITEQEQKESLSVGLNEINITNTGFLSTYPRLMFTASVAVNSIKAYVYDTKIGIEIFDSLFGLTSYETMTLNCVKGSLEIGELNRLQGIEPGTGFFSFPVGTFQFNIIVSAICELTFFWRKRYFI